MADHRPVPRLAGIESRHTTTYLNSGPLERDDIDECFVDVFVLVDKVETQVQGECRRVEDVWGGFGED